MVITQVAPPTKSSVEFNPLLPVLLTRSATNKNPGKSANAQMKNTRYGFPGSIPVLNAKP